MSLKLKLNKNKNYKTKVESLNSFHLICNGQNSSTFSFQLSSNKTHNSKPKMATNFHKTPILHSISLTKLFPILPSNPKPSLTNTPFSFPLIHKSPNFKTCLPRPGPNRCAARRRVRYDDDDEDEDEDYGHNHQIALLESYTQAATGEALIVHAMVDGDHVEVLVFKVFPLFCSEIYCFG